MLAWGMDSSQWAFDIAILGGCVCGAVGCWFLLWVVFGFMFVGCFYFEGRGIESLIILTQCQETSKSENGHSHCLIY